MLVLGFHWYGLNTCERSAFHLSQTYYLCCFTISLLGIALRVNTVGHSPKGTSGRNTDGQLADVLNTSGMYSITRNPLYLGNFLIWISIVSLSGSLVIILLFILFFTWFYASIISEEESFLEVQFGEEYAKWKIRTPKFFPHLSKYKKSVFGFNWRKVIRKEKNGLAAALGIFFLFRIAIPIEVHDFTLVESIRQEWFWSVLALVGTASYAITKALMVRGTWLDNKPN